MWSLDIAKAVTGTSFTRTYNWSLGEPDPASLASGEAVVL